MQFHQLVPLLEKLWLSPNEQRVYHNWVTIWASTIIQLAKATWLKRLTVHQIIAKFIDMGIFVEIIHGKKRLVYPSNYDGLQLLIEEKKFALRQLEQSLESSKTFFDAMQNQRYLFANTRMYQGIEGISTVLMEQAQDKKPIASIYDTHAMGNLIDAKVFHRSYQERAKQWVATKLIVPSNFRDVRHLERKEDYPVSVRTLDSAYFFATSVEIWWNKIAFHSYDQQQYSTTIMEQPQIAQMMQMLYEHTWTTALDYQLQYVLI
jgi:sugar-specific transcriptional regulator TrmB